MEFPPDDVALVLPPAELAGAVLMAFLQRWRQDRKPLQMGHVVPFDKLQQDDLRLAYTEAWVWLLNEGLVVPDEKPLQFGATTFLVPSRKARGIESIEAFDRVRKAGLLPHRLIHPIIRL